MLSQKNIRFLRIGVSCGLIVLAVLYWTDLLNAKSNIDQNLLLIIAAAIIVAIVPWELLQSLKAGPLEVVVNRPQVQNVLNKINLDRVEDDALRRFLAVHSDAIQAIVGSRVLWIDDRPERIVGQRRLFRALGLEVITALSTNEAIRLLIENPDFDLIITDIQRLGESYLLIEGYRDQRDAQQYKDSNGFIWYQLHEGVNFIVSLHNERVRERMLEWVERISGVSFGEEEDFDVWIELVREMPVIFYAAYGRERLKLFTRSARALVSDVDICNDVSSLVAKAVARLSEIYTRKIQYPTKKAPTVARRGLR